MIKTCINCGRELEDYNGLCEFCDKCKNKPTGLISNKEENITRR